MFIKNKKNNVEVIGCELAQVVGDLLNKEGKSISVAESCTGGLMADTITNVPGASDYFNSAVVTYSNQSKQKLLGVREDTLRVHGAVSMETAIAMAQGVYRNSGSDIGISITGIAGPGGGCSEKPIGTVFIGICTAEGVHAFSYCFIQNRIQFKRIVVATALDIVRQYLLVGFDQCVCKEK